MQILAAPFVSAVSAGSYEQIAGTVVVGAGGQSTIEFSSIPNTYKHLQIRGSFITGGAEMYIRLNSDTSANYSTHRAFGYGTAGQAAGGVANTTRGLFFTNNGSAGNPSLIIDILDYASANKYKTVRGIFGQDTANPELGIFSALWFNSATAVNTITFSLGSGSFAQYSKFAIYGIKG